MNTYEVEGRIYKARNEYDAVKKAYKMAKRIEWGGYVGDETWNYKAVFSCGKVNVMVRRVHG